MHGFPLPARPLYPLPASLLPALLTARLTTTRLANTTTLRSRCTGNKKGTSIERALLCR
ncbi:hypothetical protein PT2222_10052 [Paraburkholderia tropica]